MLYLVENFSSLYCQPIDQKLFALDKLFNLKSIHFLFAGSTYCVLGSGIYPPQHKFP